MSLATSRIASRRTILERMHRTLSATPITAITPLEQSLNSLTTPTCRSGLNTSHLMMPTAACVPTFPRACLPVSCTNGLAPSGFVLLYDYCHEFESETSVRRVELFHSFQSLLSWFSPGEHNFFVSLHVLACFFTSSEIDADYLQYCSWRISNNHTFACFPYRPQNGQHVLQLAPPLLGSDPFTHYCRLFQRIPFNTEDIFVSLQGPLRYLT